MLLVPQFDECSPPPPHQQGWVRRALREFKFPFFLGRFMTQVEHDISDFEEAGEAVPGGVPERQWHHHVEDDEL